MRMTHFDKEPLNFSFTASSYPEDRLRYWNGYLLFYERVEEVRTPMSAKKSRITVGKRTEKHAPGLVALS